MSDSATSSSLDVVAFMAGGYRFAVEATQVRTQMQRKADGEYRQVESVLGLPAQNSLPSDQRRVLLIKHPDGDYGVEVADPVELLSLEISTIYPLPALIAARNTLLGMRGLALWQGKIIVLVSF
jgi:hypothetical protein